ncbi:conserved hypothetical protein [Pediculus humanus corporis]|uniref:Uncharacterized protein n=1 Tax=Pediculus humanus subsp. corporis TaxID=121224 RepID=E0VRC2_PEDHC|nr:uncharacterized protein Phum_PHUM396740 [Pediculus humanus corporis]EEB15928.1 conserved hypothetical protein [Pediculus humanus corporis]
MLKRLHEDQNVFYRIDLWNQKPSFQSLVKETNKQIDNLRNLKNKFKYGDEKKLQADEKHLSFLGFTKNPRLYPKNCWTNTTLPIIITILFAGDKNEGVGFAKNIAHMASNHAALIYTVGLSQSELQVFTPYCNTSQCQIVNFNLNIFPSHVQDDPVKTVKALIIQDALNKAGGILYLDNKFRISNFIEPLIDIKPIGTFVTKQAVTTVTHPNMISYFKSSVDSFLFLPMVDTNRLILWNTLKIHNQIMLPWIQCILTPECVHPIGAQSQGCRFNKRPQYRYSGCHAYDDSALNVILGLVYNFDETNYTFPFSDTYFVLSSTLDNSTLI